MEEIKFRAWDEEKKEMVFDDFVISSSGVVQREWEDTKGAIPKAYGDYLGHYYFLDYADYYAINNYRIMQYIGLRDKNGKEVYEGDIAKWTGQGKTDGIGEIDIGIWGPKVGGKHLIYIDPIEVIGNIYENPELLDKLNAKDNEKKQ